MPPDHGQGKDGPSADPRDDLLVAELRALMTRTDPVPAAALAAARAAFEPQTP